MPIHMPQADVFCLIVTSRRWKNNALCFEDGLQPLPLQKKLRPPEPRQQRQRCVEDRGRHLLGKMWKAMAPASADELCNTLCNVKLARNPNGAIRRLVHKPVRIDDHLVTRNGPVVSEERMLVQNAFDVGYVQHSAPHIAACAPSLRHARQLPKSCLGEEAQWLKQVMPLVSRPTVHEDLQLCVNQPNIDMSASDKYSCFLYRLNHCFASKHSVPIKLHNSLSQRGLRIRITTWSGPGTTQEHWLSVHHLPERQVVKVCQFLTQQRLAFLEETHRAHIFSERCCYLLLDVTYSNTVIVQLEQHCEYNISG
mmetsp:Transcript_8854/g.21144  ORF Transcript_8854/g.21144 Transcript_8854/m.21144 type:complete len:310 (-) Transcript_8854:270-1199(-)